MAVLERCSARRVAVVPFGGGTSVVGGVEPDAEAYNGVVALDLARLNALERPRRGVTAGDARSGPARPRSRAAAGRPRLHDRPLPPIVRVRDARRVRRHPLQWPGVGGLRPLRRAGDERSGWPRRRARSSSAGRRGRRPVPDLRQLILGSEGAFGVITSLTVAVRPAPAMRVYDGWRFATFADGVRALRALAQDGPRPTVLRLSDEVETALSLARPDDVGSDAGVDSATSGCLAIVGFEGDADAVARRRSRAADVLAAHGAEPVVGAGDSWSEGRYRAPYLRDALLEAGALVETLETACFWSSLHELRAAVVGRRPSCADQREPADPAGDPLSRLPRVRGRRVAVLHGRRGPVARPDRAVAPRQGGGRRRDRRRRRHDHPPPRRRPRSRSLV